MGKDRITTQQHCLTFVMLLALMLCACGGKKTENATSGEVKNEIVNDGKVYVTDVSSDVKTTPVPTSVPSPAPQSDDEEQSTETAGYWYIDTVFIDPRGHRFIFSEPDENGYPTKITLSNISDEFDGTYDFVTDPSSVLMEENESESWLIGKMIDTPGNLSKKGIVEDNMDRSIGIDIRN